MLNGLFFVIFVLGSVAKGLNTAVEPCTVNFTYG